MIGVFIDIWSMIEQQRCWGGGGGGPAETVVRMFMGKILQNRGQPTACIFSMVKFYRNTAQYAQLDLRLT